MINVKKYKNKLKADSVIISDGEIVDSTPTIEAALRGGFNMTVRVETGVTNLHSGIFGGAISHRQCTHYYFPQLCDFLWG
jgi:hypothetical protein